MKTVVLFTLFFISIHSKAQIPSYVPSNGLVGWWPFNGNANDESGNGNNGTVNGATLTTDRNGATNSAFGFNGTSDYISVNDHPTLDVLNVTISAWFCAIDFGTVTQQIQGNIVSKREPSGWGNSFQLALEQSSPTNGIWAQYTINGSNGWVYFQSNEILPTQNWIHVVYTHDNTEAKLFINGNLVNSTLVNGGLNSNDLPMWFGARPFAGSLSHFLHGSLDDIGIWNRALTTCEIQDLYHAQMGYTSINAGLDQSVCAGNNVVLQGSGGNFLIWNDNIIDGVPFTPNQTSAYVLTGADSLGCQGMDTVIVSILQNSSSTMIETALDTFTWPVNNQTYTQGGTYTDTLVNAAGCDSIVTLQLTMQYTGINEQEMSSLLISPNPVKDVFRIAEMELLLSMNLKDVHGHQVKSFNIQDKVHSLSNLPSGIYFLELTEKSKTYVVKIMKE